MLFNSFVFLFGFLPIAFALTWAAGRRSQALAKATLILLSLAFYAYWSLAQLPILLWSIASNYLLGGQVQKARASGHVNRMRAWLALGVGMDLALLGWFKYANFFAANVNALGGHVELPHIIFPLAISFFTFQKIAYLIDSARGEAKPMTPLNFSLFAAFFPQLIAGPIVHYAEVVPQFQGRRFGRLNGRDLMVGLVIMAIGLFKKTVIADTLSDYAHIWFDMAEKGKSLSPLAAWLAATTYTLQLYFDFSGYSDMAIGLGRMFGIRLPLNFHSPLRAGSIIEYWRRWHMTLQRFIVAYIYEPLSLPITRWAVGKALPAWPMFLLTVGVPSMVTFIAVGLWHGAGWTFVAFGTMHGVYICINQAWRELQARARRRRRKQKLPPREPGRAQPVALYLLTLLAVMFANVMFNARSVSGAADIWRSMVGLQGGVGAGPFDAGLAMTIALGAAIVFLFPNTQQIMGRFDPAYNWREWRGVAPAPLAWTWRPNLAGLAFAGVTLFLGIVFIQRGQAIFLYFNF